VRLLEDAALHSLARELRARGADIVTELDVLMAGRSDDDQLSWVAANARAHCSFNRGDFCRLHTIWLREGRSRSGIILSRQDLSLGEQMRTLLRLTVLPPVVAQLCTAYGVLSHPAWPGRD